MYNCDVHTVKIVKEILWPSPERTDGLFSFVMNIHKALAFLYFYKGGGQRFPNSLIGICFGRKETSWDKFQFLPPPHPPPLKIVN